MSLTVKDVDELQQYLSGVMGRADHHAPNVDDIVLAVAGAIIWRKDDNVDIEVRQQDGGMKNILWVQIGGTRYALRYDHGSQSIQVREGSLQGPVLVSFANQNSCADVKDFFAEL